MADALTQALGQGQQVQTAAAQQIAPMMGAYDVEQAKTDTANAEKRAVLTDKIAQQQAIMDTPQAPRPDVPQFQQVDETPPTLAPPKPMQLLAQYLPVLAALGTANTKTSAIAALNAGAAASNAAEAGDQRALKQAHEDWKSQMDATLQNNKIAGDQYRAIMDDRTSSWDERMAKIAAVATQAGDRLTLADLDTGHPENILARFKMLNGAADQLGTFVNHVQTMDLQRQEQEQNAKVQNAELEIKRTAANAKLAPDVQQVIGLILDKLRQNQQLNDGEKQALDTYSKWRESGGGAGGGLEGLLGAQGGTINIPPPGDRPGPAASPAPAPAPAPGPAAKAPPAAKTTAPPANLLKEGMVTTFKNGQSWTLRGGKPVQVG